LEFSEIDVLILFFRKKENKFREFLRFSKLTLFNYHSNRMKKKSNFTHDTAWEGLHRTNLCSKITQEKENNGSDDACQCVFHAKMDRRWQNHHHQ
jgi:hypothetical protein